jgi:hypothetical protein
MRVPRCLSLSLLLLAPALAAAQAPGQCSSDLLTALPVRPHVLAPVAIELAPASTQLASATGVLSLAFDEALSVDNVLMRLRQEGCRAVANARPLNPLDPNDPAAYKPKTEFDNTPWRFNMTQDGKRMTADEFDAWMKARGVRVVGRKDTPAAVPVAADGGAAPQN